MRNRINALPGAAKRRPVPRWLLVLLIIVTALFLLAFAALYHGLVSRHYRIRSAKLANTEPIRLVLLTDLHGHVYGKDQSRLISRVRRLRPDVICIVGDMAENKRELRGVALLLEGIRGIAPCLYVPGNHEHWGDLSAVLALFSDYDVPPLQNEIVEMNIKGQELRFYCLDDPYYTRPEQYDSLMGWIGPLDAGTYNILLSHRPDPAEKYAAYGFDLALSGHAHGGQVRIPLLINGMFAPDQGWLPRYAGGRYVVGGMEFIVGRGLSYYPNLPRVFNPPEVVAIELRGR